MHLRRSMKSELILMATSFSMAMRWSCRSFRACSDSFSFCIRASIVLASSCTSLTRLENDEVGRNEEIKKRWKEMVEDERKEEDRKQGGIEGMKEERME